MVHFHPVESTVISRSFNSDKEIKSQIQSAAVSFTLLILNQRAKNSLKYGILHFDTDNENYKSNLLTCRLNRIQVQ